MLLLCLTYTDTAGELRTIFDDAPRCQTESEIAYAISPALARIRRAGGGDVQLQVCDDASGWCLWTVHFRSAAG